MKITALLLFVFCLKVSATASAQEVSINVQQAPLEKVFDQIQAQSNYRFFYDEQILTSAGKITLNVKRKNLEQVLELIFKDQPLSYKITDRTITVKRREKGLIDRIVDYLKSINISGKVVDENGEPLPGATIKIKGSTRNAVTDKDGLFVLNNVPEDAVIEVSFIGYETRELKAAEQLEITLIKSTSKLDEVQVIAYGTTTQRLSTGSVSSIKKEQLENQPVGNPLEALYGRVPGLVITQTNGLPGAAVKVLLRGRTSINNTISNDPLFIIDGVPYAPNNDNIGSIGNAASSVSPFNSISLSDIERIDILKDADATAIYGSRGSNGVVLIQTKRGAAGKTKISANISAGWANATKTTDWMNTQQYVALRKEAFKNDGVAMTNANAYDILVWDTTRYTNFKKMFLDNTAHQSGAQLSISGGNEQTQFFISGNYNRQGTIFPGDFSNKKGSGLLNLNHTTLNKQLNVSVSLNYVVTGNNSTINDLSNYLNRPPNLPELYDKNGKLNWSSGGFSFSNPLAYLLRKYEGDTKNLISNLQLSYQIYKDLKFKTSFGYNTIGLKEASLNPISAQDPANNPTGSASFSNNSFSSLIIEPQLDYTKILGAIKVSALLGGTWQKSNNDLTAIAASGYTNDLFLNSPSGASSNIVTATSTEYKYVAIFGRLNFNLLDRYVINLTARRDGSSRFGPGKQFGNFGSVGGGYIFSNEQFFKEHLPVLSYGKIRASFGVTGNDKIGDYAYLNTYTPYSVAFQGTTAIYPNGLSNSDYAWELNKKLEFALDLGILKDRFLFTGTYYRNRSSNQLLSYRLPNQSGSSSVVANFQAVVENNGFEFEVNSKNITSQNFRWSTSLNVSLPQNKLIALPSAAATSYTYLIIGQPLSVLSGLNYAGIDNSTGLPLFLTNTNTLTSTPVYTTDRSTNIGNLEPKFYGGLENSISFRNWEFSFLFEFRKQKGMTVFGNMFSTSTYPGTLFNQPVAALERWKSPGDVTELPKATTSVNSSSYTSVNLLSLYGSAFRYGDASYIRLKNASLSYNAPSSWLKHIGLNALKIFADAQNLFVITPYKYADPETQTLLRTPPMKTILVGLKTDF